MGEGDGWVRCQYGHRHWGVYGAAGLLLRHRDAAGMEWVLLQHRADWSHHGDTWALPGGARRPDETPQQTALRETLEELIIDLSSVQVRGLYRDDHGSWAYDTVLAHSELRLEVAPAGRETADVRWVAAARVAALPLHPGFGATWPLLRPGPSDH